MRIFGAKVDGQRYHARKAVYAVIPDNVGRVAAIIADSGKLWLPGGGIKTGETPEQALVREVEEECAQRLHIVGNIGEALQYFYARSDDTYFAMHAVFYAGAFLGQTTGRAEYPSSGSSLTTGRTFSMPVTPGQSSVFAKQGCDTCLAS